MDDEFEPYEVSYEKIFNHLKEEGKFISIDLKLGLSLSII